MKRFLLAILFYIPIIVGSQNTYSGIVLDSTTQQALPFVTVYINGTTNGTITNKEGYFELNDVQHPAELVISHVGYSTNVIPINNNTPKGLTIMLRTKSIDLSEVKVENKNLREKNIDLFNSHFIGADSWGENAQIKNDSVLTFNLTYNYNKIILTDLYRNRIISSSWPDIHEWANDSSFVIMRELSQFIAEAQAPLEIEMPLLGYKLRADLVDFSIQYTEQGEHCYFLGYYFFQPYEINRNSRLKRIEKNRELAYYNSNQHFLRALFNRKLAQNGYELFEKKNDVEVLNLGQQNVSIDLGNQYKVTIDDRLKKINENQMQITGLKDRHFFIIFYADKDGAPIDLTTDKKRETFTQSEIFFLSDTCTISRNGTIQDYSIMFAGEISNKEVGAFLPENYFPKENN